MLQRIRYSLSSLTEPVRAGLGRRALGIALALLLEALLLLLLLTLGQSNLRRGESDAVVVSFNAKSIPEQAATPESPEPAERSAREVDRPTQEAIKSEPSESAVRQSVEPQQTAPKTPEPAAPAAPSFVQLSREDMALFDISRMPARPARPNGSATGPPDTKPSSDTPRVEGSGPNGEPLYAASWYREPHDDELSGYLSTAQGPGWGLIACRTVPDFRVEDCVTVGEHPSGSNIARSVLAAAWQFRVRPPRIGGRTMIGEWVRIRIDYGLRHE